MDWIWIANHCINTILSKMDQQRVTIFCTHLEQMIDMLDVVRGMLTFNIRSAQLLAIEYCDRSPILVPEVKLRQLVIQYDRL